jgi:dGTPase
MDFANIFSLRRVGSDKIPKDSRSGFQRDYDRLIFSSAFRRLQNKTQVFPLPETAFVHNRLTHSLEVASVGRSLGKMVGEALATAFKANNEEAFEFYKYELPNVVAAACLAHDIGNPAFGHSGEKAISAYFLENAGVCIDGMELKAYFDVKEWSDISNFEGNANAVRVLTHSLRGRFKGGFGLTFTTIASILKYPCESTAVDKRYTHRKKYGFFQSEAEIVSAICAQLGMKKESSEPLSFCRHPFVFLVEAADDICYRVVDVEDAHRLGIVSKKEVENLFLEIVREVNRTDENADKIYNNYKIIGDPNEAIAFLRAKLINVLTLESTDMFLQHRTDILNGNLNHSLLDKIESSCMPLKSLNQLSRDKIYNHDKVIQIEIAGYNVLSELLKMFVPALLKQQPSHKEEKVLKLFPYQFTQFEEAASPYEKIMSALDYLSGMTDTYATELYRRLKGIVIPQHG